MKKINTIDVTPKWIEVYPIYCELVRRGNKEGKEILIKELKNLCLIADEYVRYKKAGIIK
jgi:hypothetical protein